MKSSDEEIPSTISDSLLSSSTRDIQQLRRKQLAMHFILASTLFERIAFYTISANLVLSLGSDTSLNWSSTNSSVAMLIFSGLLVYIVGYIVAIIGTSPSICNYQKKIYNGTNSRPLLQEQCAPWILPALTIIAVGVGAVQSNMPVFGVEQIEEPKATSQYFNKHVFVVCLGAASSKSIISYIQDKDSTKLFVGYIIAMSMLVLSIVLFIVRCQYYTHVKPYDSVVTKCFPVIKNAFHTWLEYKRTRSTIDKKDNDPSQRLLSDSLCNSTREESIRIYGWPSEFLDFAKVVNHGDFPDWIVDDVKSLRRLLIVFSLLIPYWIVYDQVYTSFLAQRRHMKIPTGVTYKTTISTLISFGDPIIIIIGLLIFNAFLYKYLEARNQSITITNRFVIGMCFASLSMCTSGVVEGLRQDKCDDDLHRSDLLIYYQIPQNILMGLSKLFLLVASYEFAYFTSRRSGRSFFMGLRYFSIGLSSFIDSLYDHIFPGTDSSINYYCQKDHTWYWSFYTYFFILSGVQLIFVLIFIICQKRYHIIKRSLEIIQ